jgi:hypothetical protein
MRGIHSFCTVYITLWYLKLKVKKPVPWQGIMTRFETQSQPRLYIFNTGTQNSVHLRAYVQWNSTGTLIVNLNFSKCETVPIAHVRNTYSDFFLVSLSLGGVRLSPLGTSATAVLLYQPRMIDDDDIDDYGVVGGMRIGRGNRSTRRKPAPVPLCPPQISHDLTWDRTRAAVVGSQRLTAWAMARPVTFSYLKY